MHSQKCNKMEKRKQLKNCFKIYKRQLKQSHYSYNRQFYINIGSPKSKEPKDYWNYYMNTTMI